MAKILRNSSKHSESDKHSETSLIVKSMDTIVSKLFVLYSRGVLTYHLCFQHDRTWIFLYVLNTKKHICCSISDHIDDSAFKELETKTQHTKNVPSYEKRGKKRSKTLYHFVFMQRQTQKITPTTQIGEFLCSDVSIIISSLE